MTPAQTLHFPTRTPQSCAEILRGFPTAPRATISGDLFLPARVSGKIPLVVTSIGSHGLTSGREALYAGALTGAGFAMFIVDSYTARGFTETISDQGKLSMASSVSDALFAVKHLAGDPRFDSGRIALMGYSRGGAVSVQGWDERLQAAMLGDLRTVAHVALYPPCYTQWRHPRPPKSPILMIFGGQDELALQSTGEDYARKLVAAGGRAKVVGYPQARHSFDAAYAATFNPLTSVLADTRIFIEDDGEMVEDFTGLRAGEDWSGFLHALGAARGRRGATTGHGPLPRDVAVGEILAFLNEAFGRTGA